MRDVWRRRRYPLHNRLSSLPRLPRTFDPSSVHTASGYYHLAQIFTRLHQLENSLAFFDKVVEIWYKFLANVRNKADEQMDDLSETQLMEATEQLKQILEMRKKFLGVDHIATGEVGLEVD